MMPDPSTDKQTVMVKDMTVQVASSNSRFDKKFKNAAHTVGAFVKLLSEPTRTRETQAEFASMPKAQQDDIKDIGGYVAGMLKDGVRNAKSVANRSLITLDLDNAGSASVGDVLAGIAESLPGVAHVIHSTHKHKPGCVRLRVIVVLARPVFPDEYQAIARKLAAAANIEWFDDSTYDPSRLMYWPSVSRDADYLFLDHTYEDGAAPLDPDAILASYGYDEQGVALWSDSTFWPVSSRQANVVQRAMRMQKNPLEKTGFVGAFCRVYDIHQAISAFLHDIYRREGTRYSYVDGSTSKGVVLYGLSDDDKRAVWAYSNHATDPAHGQLCNAFDLVRIHLFGEKDYLAKRDTPGHRLPSYLAMLEHISDIPEVRQEEGRMSLPDVDPSVILSYFDDYDGVEAAKEKAAEDGSDAWKALLTRNKDKSVQAGLANAALLLENEPSMKNMAHYNEFELAVEFQRKRMWTDEDTSTVRRFLSQNYGLGFTKADMQDAVNLVAKTSRKYHPVKDYLMKVNGTWDGIQRIPSMFVDYLGDEDNPFTRQAAQCWALAAVSRIWKPGYKFDYVPVLSGAQGIGKSTFCRILAKDWFGELGSFEDQKAVEQMKNCWISEIAEMTAMTRHEIEEQKRFISATFSTVRLPYRHNPERFERQTVFMGTTNTHEYLKDSTGNRRWWPIYCRTSKIDTDKLRINVDQLWAEAMELHADPDYRTELTVEAIEIAIQRQNESRVSDSWEGIVTEWLKQKAHIKRYDADYNSVADALPCRETDLEIRDRVCVQEIWQDCLGGKKQDLKGLDSKRIGAIIDRNPMWTRGSTIRFGERFGRQRGWFNTSTVAPF